MPNTTMQTKIAYSLRWISARWLRAVDRSRRNRRRYYGDATGMRILNFHAIPGGHFPRFTEIAEYCLEHFDVVNPTELDALAGGHLRLSGRDKIVFTFDDGYADHHRAASWLAHRGVRGIFFVVPSFIGRSIHEYLTFHEARGVIAVNFCVNSASEQGLTRSQVLEMASMGHRIGAHNYAHRDLGSIRLPEDLDYEIRRTIEGIQDLTGYACEDFALAFGHPEHVSDEAINYLKGSSKRIYACVRGLNIPGLSPAYLLRDDTFLNYPLDLIKLCLQCGADDRYESRRMELLRRTGRLTPSILDRAI